MSRELSFCRQSRGWRACAPLLLLLALLLSSAPLFAKTVTLTVTDNNTSISLIEGDTLIVTLPSPIADSYKWQLQLGKPSPLTPLQDTFTPANGPKGIPTQTFRFNAAVVTEGLLLFRFERQKPGPAPEVTQTFSVDVALASGEPKSLVLLGIYRGTTACADCIGIQTKLRLYSKGKNDFTDNIYISTRTYQGGRGGDQSFTDRGEWSLNKGDAVDPNATVYALSPDDPQKAQYFLVQTGGASLTLLDQQMKPIDAPPQYQSILKRVQ
jgi:copper homeostasis protein (lipoprotein)